MKTVVLKSVEGRISLGNPMMTKAGVSNSGAITILVHNVPIEIEDIKVARMYESAIIVPQSVFEFDYSLIDVPAGTMIWLNENERPHGVMKNGIKKTRLTWDNGDENTLYLGSAPISESMNDTVELMHGRGKGLKDLDPTVLSWYKNRQSFTAQCGNEIFKYDRNAN